MLSVKNEHSRDKHISFEEGPHIYTVCGERGSYTSVTTWVHRQFPHFDAESIANNIIKSRKMTDPKYKYYNMTKPDILKMWADSGAAASEAGTLMHLDIEVFSNGFIVNNDSVEFKYFKNFLNDYPTLTPYRTEWMVYYEELKISGSIDMVYRDNVSGEFYIYDWKRSKEIKYDDPRCDFCTTKCINHIPNLNFWHYSMQLGIYKRILEDKYDVKIAGMYLIILHPDQKNYERIQVANLDTEIDQMFIMRRDSLCKNN